ncbi:MAG TPA: PAS domain S-box protein, partial [Halococcus sp.]|nr:PAS domain S-box protein [Halococcus sp.]
MDQQISVLLVDDEPAVADLAALYLERFHDDITVETETAGKAALARFSRDPELIDCIVSDYTMPGMDGLEFLAAVRETHPAIPFVLFTGKGSEEIASEAISAGVTDYLQKGTGTEQYELLANRVENAVFAHRGAERAAELARINRMVSEVQRELVRQTTREDIEEVVCRCFAESGSYTLAWIGTPDDDGALSVHDCAGTGIGYLDEVDIRADDTPRGRGPAGTALRSGTVQIMGTTESAAFEPWRKTAARYGHESVIVLPLTYSDAGYGVLAIYSNRRHAFDTPERDGLTELAGTVAQAIHATETRAQFERRERALATSERKYRSLIDAAPDAIFIADADTGEIVETNAAGESLLLRSREEIIGMHQSALHPDAERYRELFEHSIATKNPSIIQFADGSDVRVERADGERVPVEISAKLVDIGERTLVHGRFRDVSANRERERELHTERAVTESILDATPDSIYAFDSEGGMLRWNDEFAETVGYTDEEIAGMNCLEFVPEADRQWMLGEIRDIITDGVTVTIESSFVTKDGECVPHELRGARLTDGEAVRGVIGSARDITEHKRREEIVGALHTATRELVRAEDKKTVAKATARAAEEILDFPITVVRLYDAESEKLEPVGLTDGTTDHLGERPSYARGEGFPWRAFESGDPVIASDSAARSAIDGSPMQSALYVPIGEHGTLSIASLDADFEDSDIGLTRLLAANATAALDRVEREAQLRRYERMLDTAGDMVYALDTEGRFTAVNDTFVEETGYSRAEVVGEHVSLALDAEDVAHGETLIQGLLSREQATNSDSYEITVHTTTGESIPCETRIALLHTDGKFEGSVGVVRDITARKQYERLLESLHDATRGMMEAETRTGVAEVAVETAERILGMALNGIWFADENVLRPVAASEAGRELLETIPTYTRGESLAWEAFERGETRQYDHVEREPNALNPETRIRSEMLVPLGEYGVLTIGSTEPGQFTESDLSLSKLLAANTEAALNRAERERQLVVEHDRLTALFENIPDPALSFEFADGEPIFHSVNARFEEVFGYPAREVIGEPVDGYVVPPGREEEASGFNEALLCGETVRTTVRRQTKSAMRDFLLHVVPLEPGERNTEGYAIYTDITEQKRHERDLERQNELLDDFASVISHDLRNPMSVVRG